MPIAHVALDVPLNRLFDYLCAEVQSSDIGRCIRVPFGRSEKTGIIVAVSEHSDQPPEKLRSAQEVVRSLPALPADWLDLTRFCSRYYQHPLGEVMALALPPYLRRGKLPRLPKPRTASASTAPSLPELRPEQAEAIAQVMTSYGRFTPFLLHGITGSGKTEVYLRLIAETLTLGKQALMLVPEIALTPQLEGRVRARFPQARIVAAHSGLAEAARARGFIAALEGEVDILLGTRLAVFAPLRHLGLIIVDEEHDASFKQQEGLRYSARDVAIWRAQQRQVPIVLGSATPALETYWHARPADQGGRYHYLQLTRRAVASTPPEVRCLDTRREKLQDGLSAAMLHALEARLERREQSLVFLNRRGYAPVLSCPACGWVSRCRRCAANLVVHLTDKRLRCHHCSLETAIPRHCPSCGNLDIHAFGRGTQRLEEHLRQRFPAARILRVDRDSANTPAKWQAVLDDIHAGRVDILVGTQMLAKGHDFPRLTLVGVVGADAALFAADFRAAERLFAQLMQVGGRSGRAELPGEVLIQTEYPQHPLYQALVAHDYARFAKLQLDERQAAGFPPYTFQALLRAEAPEIDTALNFLREAAALAQTVQQPWPASLQIYDPIPMRMVRMKSMERAQLLIESASRPLLHRLLESWMQQLRIMRTSSGLRWHLDVDPMEF